ncbi:CTP synthase ura7 [Gonapodya sp. JEL0774]|nr:CTP synthase ura7 [Gonapodya sp. JEL0774]
MSSKKPVHGTAINEFPRSSPLRYDRNHDRVSIVLVGKYTQLADAYISVVKSLEHAALNINRKLDLHWIESEHLEESQRTSNPAVYHEAWKALCAASGILVPGGFGYRGAEGKISAIKWAREHKVPFLGMFVAWTVRDIMVYNVPPLAHPVALEGATSEEMDKEGKHQLIKFMPEIDPTTMGGTMRLGERKTIFTESGKGSLARKLYHNRDRIRERHRHRYEVNTDFKATLEAKGMRFVGQDESAERMEIIELSEELNHPFFLGVQYHPEFLSRPLRPSPPYLGLLLAASGLLDEYLDQLGKSRKSQLETSSNHVFSSTNGSQAVPHSLNGTSGLSEKTNSPSALSSAIDGHWPSDQPSSRSLSPNGADVLRQGSLYRNPSFPPDFNTEASDDDTLETLAATLAVSPTKSVSLPSADGIPFKYSNGEALPGKVGLPESAEEAGADHGRHKLEKMGLALPEPIAIVGGGAGRLQLANSHT